MRRFSLIAVSLCILLVVSACGSDRTPTDPSPTPGPIAAPTASPTPAPTTIPLPSFVGLSVDDAMAAAAERDLTLVPILRRSDGSPGRVLEQGLPPGTPMLAGATIDIIVSEAVPRVIVPDLDGIRETSGTAQLLALELLPADRTVAFHKHIPAGRIIRTDHAAGTEVLAGTLIGYRVSAGPTPTPSPTLLPLLDVPGLLGLDEAEATRYALALGFEVVVSYLDDPLAVPGTVLAQTPDPGRTAAPGSVIELQVAGVPALVSPPKLYRMTVPEAEAALAAAGLVLGDVEWIPAQREAGTIVRFRPTPREPVAPGSAIDIVVSLGPDAS